MTTHLRLLALGKGGTGTIVDSGETVCGVKSEGESIVHTQAALAETQSSCIGCLVGSMTDSRPLLILMEFGQRRQSRELSEKILRDRKDLHLKVLLPGSERTLRSACGYKGRATPEVSSVTCPDCLSLLHAMDAHVSET